MHQYDLWADPGLKLTQEELDNWNTAEQIAKALHRLALRQAVAIAAAKMRGVADKSICKKIDNAAGSSVRGLCGLAMRLGIDEVSGEIMDSVPIPPKGELMQSAHGLSQPVEWLADWRFEVASQLRFIGTVAQRKGDRAISKEVNKLTHALVHELHAIERIEAAVTP